MVYPHATIPARFFARHCQSTQLLRDCAAFLGERYYELQKRVTTRWWSEVTSVKSLVRNRKALEALQMKRAAPCPALLQKLDWDFLEVLLEIMVPFAEATAAMEADKTPTIGYVLGMVVYLKNALKELGQHANPAIGAAARDMLEDFDQR